jgi:DNA-binding NtrC family response regulator
MDGNLEGFSDLGLIGRSTEFLDVLRKVRRIADLDVTVTIYGETGTGKELIARAIHYSGNRAEFPFIPVNCAALPDTLFENELFGHERGAFTDASGKQLGLVAQADGGTLFLDEIEALTPKAQATLLRFMQDKTYRSLGSQTEKAANVRIVAATNENFEYLVAECGFRNDLYFRFGLIPIKLPLLCERGEDVILLTNYFLLQYQHQYQNFSKRISEGALAAIRDYRWPGNIRELENLIHRAFLLSENDEISLDDLFKDSLAVHTKLPSSDVLLSMSFQEAKSAAVNGFEKNYLRVLMDRFDGNISAASLHSGKDRSSLSKLLKKHHV